MNLKTISFLIILQIAHNLKISKLIYFDDIRCIDGRLRITMNIVFTKKMISEVDVTTNNTREVRIIVVTFTYLSFGYQGQ